MTKPIDFYVANHGTIFTFEPRTTEAKVWWADHVDPEAMQVADAFVVEHRFARDIADGIAADGLALA